MQNFQIIFWAAVIAIAIGVELLTVGLTTIWVALGAIFALVVCFAGGSIQFQIAVFLIVTLVTLYFTRPLAVKYLNKNRMKTNVEETIGQRVRVIQRIDNGAATGRVNYKGMEGYPHGKIALRKPK